MEHRSEQDEHGAAVKDEEEGVAPSNTEEQVEALAAAMARLPSLPSAAPPGGGERGGAAAEEPPSAASVAAQGGVPTAGAIRSPPPPPAGASDTAGQVEALAATMARLPSPSTAPAGGGERGGAAAEEPPSAAPVAAQGGVPTAGAIRSPLPPPAGDGNIEVLTVAMAQLPPPSSMSATAGEAEGAAAATAATELLQEAMARAITVHGSLKIENSGARVGIRSSPAYPGDRTGDIVEPGEVHDFKAQCIVPHTLDDGQHHDIYFYELADGRG